MADFINSVTGVEFDEIIGGTTVKAMTANGTLTVDEAGTVERGTLLSGTDNTYTVCASGGEATAILAHDVVVEEAGDVTATVYTAGLFNRDRITVADGDTVDAHEDELRSLGIYLTHIYE